MDLIESGILLSITYLFYFISALLFHVFAQIAANGALF